MNISKTSSPATLDKISRRDRIVQAAYELFAARHFNAVSTKEIADRANVSQRLMWYYFKSKEALRAAADDFVLDQIGRLAEPAAGRPLHGRFGVIVDAAARFGSSRVLDHYVRRMLIDDGPRGAELLGRIMARIYVVLETPGDPQAYSSLRRQHEIALIALLLGPIVLKPALDARFGVDVHGPHERDARLEAIGPLIAAALDQPFSWDAARDAPSSKPSGRRASR